MWRKLVHKSDLVLGIVVLARSSNQLTNQNNMYNSLIFLRQRVSPLSMQTSVSAYYAVALDTLDGDLGLLRGCI